MVLHYRDERSRLAEKVFWRSGEDLSPWRPAEAWQSTGGVFLRDEILVAASFEATRSRLARLAEGSELLRTSQVAYNHGIELTTRVGAAGLSKLVQIQVAPLAGSAGPGLAIRWQATGPGSLLFPVLDADMTLTPADEMVTMLGLTGAYRPPLASIGEALDHALLRRVAAATVRNFITRLAAAISDNSDPATGEPGRS